MIDANGDCKFKEIMKIFTNRALKLIDKQSNHIWSCNVTWRLPHLVYHQVFATGEAYSVVTRTNIKNDKLNQNCDVSERWTV